MTFAINSPNLPNSLNLDNIRPQIKELQPNLVNWRRSIHKRPELGFKEEITAEFIAKKLREWSIPHQTGIAKTGIVALIEGGKPGKVQAIRADIDALPIQEANEVPYRSQHAVNSSKDIKTARLPLSLQRMVG